MSKERQVIVLTHRLSLLSMLNDAIEDKLEIIGIRKDQIGAGEIGDLPLFAKNPEKVLNKFLNESISKAKKLSDERSQDFDVFMSGLCSDFRIVIERIIEEHLLADVVKRYRRSIKTMGKMHKLSVIEKEDCEFIDDFMTRYSYYEHSQPTESPVDTMELPYFKTDVKNLLDWLKDFKERQKKLGQIKSK